MKLTVLSDISKLAELEERTGMAKKPESGIIDRLHRKMSKSIYKMKMNMGMGAPNGVPDYYYEGDAGSCWVEYKYSQVALPSRRGLKLGLSLLQEGWLVRAVSNNIPAYVITGDDYGNYWIDDMSKQRDSKTVPIIYDSYQTNTFLEKKLLKKNTEFDKESKLAEVHAQMLAILNLYEEEVAALQIYTSKNSITLVKNPARMFITNPDTAMEDFLYFLNAEFGLDVGGEDDA